MKARSTPIKFDIEYFGYKWKKHATVIFHRLSVRGEIQKKRQTHEEGKHFMK